MGKKSLIKHENMPIVYNSMSRRLFLQSSLGYIALPLIASLVPRAARAQLASENSYRRAVFLMNPDGGNFLDAIPLGVKYSQTQPNVLAGSLATAQLGPVYNSQYQNLRSKVSVLMGLSSAAAVNHCQSNPLMASFSGFIGKNGSYSVNGQKSLFPDSIDTILANKIYGSNHPQNLRVLRLGGGGCSFSGDNYNTIEGIKVYNSLNGIEDDAALSLLLKTVVVADPGNGSQPSAPNTQELINAKRRDILEKALAFTSETKTSGKVGTEARARISDFQEMLAQVRDTVPNGSSSSSGGDAPIQTSMSCGSVKTSADEMKARADIITAALACGATRLATLSLPSSHELAHGANSTEGRESHLKFTRDDVLPVGAYLMGLMDQVVESNGKTLLENSCVLITSHIGSSASSPHNGHSMRVMIGGGLNGKLRMGEAIDFQNRSVQFLQSAEIKTCSQGIRGDAGIEQARYGGRPYNELLITIMRAFGLSPSDYHRNGKTGYGHYVYDEIPKKELFHTTHLQPSKPNGIAWRTQNYFRDVVLKNYDRDTTLPYFLKS